MVVVSLLVACSSKPQKPQINSVEVTPTPVPKVLTDPGGNRPLLVDSLGKPMSFAPLVEKSDASVAIVRAIERGTSASGRVGTLSEGLGTAFVYDPDGYLLTNHHVIEKATDVLVGFRDGKDYRAKVIGADARTDLAVLKIDAKDLPSLPLGNSDQLLVGDWVVAIGNPFGLGGTATAGIVSADGRELLGGNYNDFIQIDAPLDLGQRNTGDLSFLLKYAFFNERETGNLMSLGLVVTAPTGTGNDVELLDGTTLPTSVLLQPWLGGVRMFQRGYTQAISSMLIPTSTREPTLVNNSVAASAC